MPETWKRRVAWLDGATFEERRSLVRLLLRGEHGCLVKLHRDGGIEIQGMLPTATATATVEMRLKVAEVRRPRAGLDRSGAGDSNVDDVRGWTFSLAKPAALN